MTRQNLALALAFVFLASCTSYQKPNTAETQNYEEPREPAGQSVRLQDSPNFQYEVLFTNPKCGPYVYKEPQKSFSGKTLTQKPENVFCKNMIDLKKSGDQITSPQNRLISWIQDDKVTEIFMTYLSYRNKAVTRALCDAIKLRGLKFTLVMSSTEDDTVPQTLNSCVTPEKGGSVRIEKRGQEGGIGYAHNKITIFNPQKITSGSQEMVKIVFSSGNMTSGPVMHHENWHFLTVNSNTHFAQMHKCVMNAELDEKAGHSAEEYYKYITSCRTNLIAKGLVEESDIKSFFVPGEGETIKVDGKKRAFDYMFNGDGVNPGIKNAKEIRVGAHRFFYNKMINALRNRMNSFNKPILKIVADDDTFYKGYLGEENFSEGDTHPAEWENMKQFQSLGGEVKFMETNHAEHQLHHSKFLIFDDKAVFAGSANLTGAGFKTNWENIYYITIPSAVKAFRDQYDNKLWNMATSPMDLPENPHQADNVIVPEQGASLIGENEERAPAGVSISKANGAACGYIYKRGDTNYFARDTGGASYVMRVDCNLDGRVNKQDRIYVLLDPAQGQRSTLTKWIRDDMQNLENRESRTFACMYDVQKDLSTICDTKPVEPLSGQLTKAYVSQVYSKVFKKQIEVINE